MQGVKHVAKLAVAAKQNELKVNDASEVRGEFSIIARPA